MAEQGFIRSPDSTRFWWGPLQLQAWRGGAWHVAFNGRRWCFSLGGDPRTGWQADVLDGGWRSATLSVVPLCRPGWRNGLAVVLQRDPLVPNEPHGT